MVDLMKNNMKNYFQWMAFVMFLITSILLIFGNVESVVYAASIMILFYIADARDAIIDNIKSRKQKD